MTSVRTDPEERAAALAVYRELGLAEAHRLTGITKNRLRRWAQQEGLNPAELAGAAVEQTEAANAARNARIDAMRLELRESLLASAVDMTERLTEPHKDFRGKDMTEVLFDQAPADACRNYAVAAAVFIDKFRLESGESTARSESLSGDLVAQKVRVGRMRDELADRRPSRSA